MTDAFVKAAEAKGHTVARFDTAQMDIGGCTACETCYKTGKPCKFGDDFNTIAPRGGGGGRGGVHHAGILVHHARSAPAPLPVTTKALLTPEVQQSFS